MLDECVVTNEKLNILLAEWTDRLKLQEWNITVGIYRESEFYEQGNMGENTFQRECARSTIKILDHCDYPTDTKFLQNMEKTLVHELLHLKFCYFEPEEDTIAHEMWHRAIETLSETLVKAKYEKPKRE